jgi:uncharacterized protein YcnI
MSRFTGAAVAAASVALVLPAAAFAHAEISPPVALAKHAQVFTIAVPTEKENATTVAIRLTVPDGFAIDSFAPAPGWIRQQEDHGGPGGPTRIDWRHGNVPTGEDAIFQILAEPGAAKTYTFQVRQTYSDGSVVDWSGPESSDTPAPTLKAVSSLGGGGSSTLALVALLVGAIGLLLGVVGLAGGRRALG